MTSISSDNLLELRPDTIQYVRQRYGLGDPKKMEEAVDIFEDWVKKQNHFIKKNFHRKYLEVLIISSKGSIERAKSKLDKVCTLKTILPHLYSFKDIREDFKLLFSCITLVPLPKLTENHCRIISLKPTANEFFHDTPFTYYYIYFLMYCEHLYMYDYSDGYIVILDYRDVKVTDLIAKLNVMEYKQYATLVFEGYGMRVQGIHIITTSKAVETLLSMVKPLVSPKIAERFRVHNSVESLHGIVSKDILPEEYGGHERSLKELQDDWVDLLSSKESMEYLKEMREARVNETHRLNSTFNEHLGMHGTFRSLNVD